MTLMANTSILHSSSGYRCPIKAGIPPLGSPHREHSFGPLSIPFAPFLRSFLHSCTLGRNFEPLTILQVTLGYRHVITKRIPPLDFPHREHSFGLLHTLFAPFSRSFLHTFTLGRNFEPLTILQAILGYRHAMAKWIPRLDFPPPGHSLESLNVPFAPFSGFSFSLICI